MIIYNLIPSLCYFWLWRIRNELQQYSYVRYPPFLRSLIQQIQCIPCRRSAVIAKSCYYKVGYSICTAFVCFGRWGYTLRIYALYIRLKHKSLQRPVNFWKLLQNCIKCAIIKHTKGTIALSQSDGFASSWWGAVSFLQELYSLCVVFFYLLYYTTLLQFRQFNWCNV